MSSGIGLDATGYVDPDTLDATGYVDPDTLDATGYVDPDTLDATGYVDPDTLDTLPYQGRELRLTIRRDLTDDDPAIDWCCHLVAQLCPLSRGGYSGLVFRDRRLTSVGGERLLRGLHRRGVTGNILTFWIQDSEENKKYLRELGASLNNFNNVYILLIVETCLTRPIMYKDTSTRSWLLRPASRDQCRCTLYDNDYHVHLSMR
nr:uncharacterized protein LOC123748230 [Procambarus clarkii]